MKVPFISFDARNECVRAEAIETFQNFFDSKWYVLGSYTREFEENYASFIGTKYCVGVSTGLDALHLALKALGVGIGDEVIVPSNTYIASVLAISFTGATPVFVEPRKHTFNIDVDLIEEAVTARTKVIMPVHLYGQACEMGGIMDLASKYQLKIVEDNAQAHGARFQGRLTGSFGDINAVSFYPTKNLGALGEAGAITTDNRDYAEKIRLLRNYGSESRYSCSLIGYNNRIDEFEAAYLNLSLRYLERWNKCRGEIASLYKQSLADLDKVILPRVADGATTVNHQFVVRAVRRNELKAYLERRGVATTIHYPVPPHLQECYRYLGYKKGDFPIAEQLANTCLSLPMYVGLSKESVEYVSGTIHEFYHKFM